MSITCNIRHLERKPARLEGEISPEALAIIGLDELIKPVGGVRYDLEVRRQGGELLVEGALALDLECECVRCLKPFPWRIELEGWSLLLPLEGEEKVPVDNDFVDLTPLVREDIVLSFPQHPLCGDGCRGLQSAPRTRSLTESGARGHAVSAWAELDKLKF